MSGSFQTWSQNTPWGRRFFYRYVVDRGGHVIFTSQRGYASAQARDLGIRSARSCADAPVVPL